MRVLVTGGAGFVGAFVVEALVKDGCQVRVFDNLDPQVHRDGARNLDEVKSRIEFVRGDVRDRDSLRGAIEGVDRIVHLAAVVGVGQSMYEVVRYVDHNTLGTAVLLDILANDKHRVKKLVVASSMSIYGEGAYACRACGDVQPGLRSLERMQQGRWEVPCPSCGGDAEAKPTAEDKPLQPTSIYAIGKRDQEEMCLAIGQAYGIPAVALRFFNIYGPRQSLNNPYTGVAAIFSSRLLNGNAPVIYEDGLQSRDFITVLDIARILSDRLGVEVAPQIVGKFREGDIRHCYADISKIQRTLGFVPGVPLETGMDDLVSWVRQQSAADLFQRAAAELEARKLTK
jgi:dTDP-L-rhamnose 4-epimerase